MKPFEGTGAFRPTEANVRDLAVRGAGAILVSGAVTTALQVIATVTLARLLTPRDFGVVAMVTTFCTLLLNFGLNGFTEAILQFEEIDHILVSNLFWINLGVGLLLTIGFAASGSLLALFYRDPVVARVAVGTSVAIFINSTCIEHLALLKRAMCFSVVSLNDIIARTISVVLSIVLAWAGLGYWALVAGVVAIPASTSIGAWTICRWTPGLPRPARNTIPMVKFAMNVYGRFTVNYVSRNTDNLLVGWRFNASALGLYKKAYDLFALSTGLLVSPLSNVAISALSRFDPRSPQFRRYLINCFAVLALVGMGLGANLTLVGKDVIRLVLGVKWGESGKIFTFFGPGIGIMMLYFAHGWIHLSIGRADRWFRWGIVELVFTCLLFVLGLHWGPVGVAVAWTASFWILTIPALWYAGKPIGFGVAPMLAAVWRFVAAAVVGGCISALVLPRISIAFAGTSLINTAARIGIGSLCFLSLYLGAVIILHRGLSPIHQVVRLARGMAPFAGLFGAPPQSDPAPVLVESDETALAEVAPGL